MEKLLSNLPHAAGVQCSVKWATNVNERPTPLCCEQRKNSSLQSVRLLSPMERKE